MVRKLGKKVIFCKDQASCNSLFVFFFMLFYFIELSCHFLLQRMGKLCPCLPLMGSLQSGGCSPIR